MIDLYPAIDLLAGKVVRLRQGDYADQTTYGDDPVAVAQSFAAAGARWIHVVDLDAARTGSPLNRRMVAAIASAVERCHDKTRTLVDVCDYCRSGRRTSNRSAVEG